MCVCVGGGEHGEEEGTEEERESAGQSLRTDLVLARRPKGTPLASPRLQQAKEASIEGAPLSQLGGAREVSERVWGGELVVCAVDLPCAWMQLSHGSEYEYTYIPRYVGDVSRGRCGHKHTHPCTLWTYPDEERAS